MGVKLGTSSGCTYRGLAVGTISLVWRGARVCAGRTGFVGGMLRDPSITTTNVTGSNCDSSRPSRLSGAAPLELDGSEIDLESVPKHDFALEVERPQHRPRMCMSSIYVRHLCAQVEPPLVTALRLPRRSRPPLPTLASADVKEGGLSVYTELDVNAGVGERGYGGGVGGPGYIWDWGGGDGCGG